MTSKYIEKKHMEEVIKDPDYVHVTPEEEVATAVDVVICQEDLYPLLYKGAVVQKLNQAMRGLQLEGAAEDAAVQQAKAELELHHSQRATEYKTLERQRDAALAKLEEQKKTVNAKYGIDLEKVVIDDTTGKVSVPRE